MNAVVVAFPKKRKRGAKCKTGPVADVLYLKPPHAVSPRGRALLDKVYESIRREEAENRLREAAAFDSWLSGSVIGTDEYSRRTTYGSATANPGRGPDAYRRGLAEVCDADVLRFNESDKALQVAVNMLNDLATLVRWGGLKVGGGYAKDGFDQEELRACEAGAISSLGFTMQQLRAFGGRG